MFAVGYCLRKGRLSTVTYLTAEKLSLKQCVCLDNVRNFREDSLALYSRVLHLVFEDILIARAVDSDLLGAVREQIGNYPTVAVPRRAAVNGFDKYSVIGCADGYRDTFEVVFAYFTP